MAVERALEQLREDSEQDPNPNLVSSLAISYLNLGRSGEAIDAYEQALDDMDPYNPGASLLRFNLGQAHYRLGHRDLAVNEFRQVIRVQEAMLTSQALLDAARAQLSAGSTRCRPSSGSG